MLVQESQQEVPMQEEADHALKKEDAEIMSEDSPSSSDEDEGSYLSSGTSSYDSDRGAGAGLQSRPKEEKKV
jgi:hypothetical protein